MTDVGIRLQNGRIEMACKLRKSIKPGVDFEANTGDQVKLGVSSDSGGAPISSPWVFTVAAGTKFLTVLIDNPVPRDWTTIEEVCNGSRNPLKHYPFDPCGPTQTFLIEGN
jgi:hypothetical protein